MIGGRNQRPLISNWQRQEFLVLKNSSSEDFAEAINQTKADVVRYGMKPGDCDIDLSELLRPSLRSTDAEILQDDEKTLAWFCETVGYVAQDLESKSRGAVTNALHENLVKMKKLMASVLVDNHIEIIQQSFDGLEKELNSIVRDFLGDIDKENRRAEEESSDDVAYAVRNFIIIQRARDWQDWFFLKDLPKLSE